MTFTPLAIDCPYTVSQLRAMGDYHFAIEEGGSVWWRGCTGKYSRKSACVVMRMCDTIHITNVQHIVWDPDAEMDNKFDTFTESIPIRAWEDRFFCIRRNMDLVMHKHNFDKIDDIL